jgi:hypothetical protein
MSAQSPALGLLKWPILKWIVAVGLVLFLALQLVRPHIPNPPVTADLQAPPEVKQILKNSCYNCHSNETTLSWFDWPVPAYWLVVHDVREGRRHLNFSEIDALPTAQQRGILYESLSQIELGAMPPPAYTSAHPSSVITAAEIAILKNYLKPPPLPIATPEQIVTSDAQYQTWIRSGSGNTPASNVAPAPNDLPFPSDYKNWIPISSTDHATIRQILGNELALKAIAQNRIKPWPDGAAFAKVAWLQQKDADGIVRAGSFYQVEFMMRDSKKFAATLGWGWSRWRGANLTPYGKNASFADECVGCHRPLANTNYVFTAPIGAQQ